MKYKYSRKVIAENIKTYLGLMHLPYEAQKLAEDLLAQKEDKKEWKPCDCPKGGIDGDGMVCDKCGGTEWVKVKSTPSPLEIEEIEDIKLKYNEDEPFYEINGRQHIDSRVDILAKVVKKLISNQKKLYQFIKEK